jgi:hypothetical protein
MRICFDIDLDQTQAITRKLGLFMCRWSRRHISARSIDVSELEMTKTRSFLIAAAVAASTALASFPADAFWRSFFPGFGGWGGPWGGWGGPWGGWGGPWSGWGYPYGWGYGGYSPYWGGLPYYGYGPYGWGAPVYGYPAAAAPAAAAESTEK